jgi:hypothetical protein
MRVKILARSSLDLLKSYVRVFRSKLKTELIAKHLAMLIKFFTKKENYVI